MKQMKQTGIRWIGEIPSDWSVKRIKYVATLKGRIGWQGLTSEEYQDEGAYLITGVDFLNGGIDWEKCEHVPMSRWEEAKDIQIQNGDLLITKDGTVGKVAIVKELPGETSLNSGVLRIVLHDGYSTNYLYWVLQSEVFWNWFNFKNAGNSTIVHLYQGDFNEFSYAYPSFEEQESIAHFLNDYCGKIDNVIDTLYKEIDVLLKYKKSIISEAVTRGLNKQEKKTNSGVEWIGNIPKSWDVKPLNHVTSLRNGYVGPTRDLFVDDGVIYLQSLHIKEGNITFENYPPYYVPEKWATLHPIIKTNDVLIVQTGEIGQIGLVTSEYDGCSCHALIIATPDPDQIRGDYLRYYFMSAVGMDSLLMFQTGTTLLHLNSTKIKHSKVIVPPVKEQKKIVEFLDKKVASIDGTLEEKNKALLKMQEYKRSVIYEYVTGKKRVKEVM